MSKIFFSPVPGEAPPQVDREPIVVKAPPIIPPPPPQGVWRKLLPVIIGVLIVALFLLFIFASFQSFSLQNLLYPFIILLLAIGVFQGTQGGTDTNEINRERRGYLNYLIMVRERIMYREKQQRKYLHWQFPDPKFFINMIGTPRQWDRSPAHPYHLQTRIGLGSGKLSTPLKLEITHNEEVDYEPVCGQAVTELFAHHGTLDEVPYLINLQEVSNIVLVGDDYGRILDFVRALTLGLALSHDQHSVRIGAWSPEINTPEWSWLKWLPHCEYPGEYDTCGAARYLFDDYDEFIEKSRPTFVSRAQDATYEQTNVEHYVFIGDFYNSPNLPAPLMLRDLTSIRIVRELPKDQDINFDPRRPIYRIGKTDIYHWQHDHWEPLSVKIDTISADTAITMSRRLAKWDTDQISSQVKNTSSSSNVFTDLMGISDASELDVDSLWAPRSRAQELVVPLGIQTDGSPLFLDLKEGDEGGAGPHGLIIGMTGSGKSQTIAEIVLSLLLTHPADRLIVIYADFKGEAEADSFKDFPQVVAVISNMADKKYMVERFAETLRGIVERRELVLREAGRKYNHGAAFKDVREYEEAIAGGINLPPIPTLLIVADEFTIMLQDHPEYADLFDMVARKGRSLRIHILFASQTLDVGRIRDIDKNVNYRICLKVADMSTSRQIIGTDQAYFIDSSKESKGVGYFVKSPGEKPIRFKSAYVRGSYIPPQEAPAPMLVKNSASWFTATSPGSEAIAPQVIDEYETGSKLIPLIKYQLATLEPHAPRMWLPPLDAPIPLGMVTAKYQAKSNEYRWPLGEIDLPRQGRRDILIYDAHSAQGNLIIHGGPQTGRSTALLTFILSASIRHDPEKVQFYCISYGGNSLAWIEDLDHTVAVAMNNDEEKIRRIFNQLDTTLAERKKFFRDQKISSITQFHELVAPGISTAEIFIIIDELYLFSKHTTETYQTKNPYLENLIRLTAEGPSYGIHLIATTVSWMYLPVDIQHNVGMRLEMKLPNSSDTSVRLKDSIHRPQDSIPSMPGRGITMTGEHFLFCLPCLDEQESVDDLHDRIAESISIINGQHLHPDPFKLQLLPENIAVPDHSSGALLQEKFPIGVGEKNLDTVYHDFRQHPLLLVVGDQKAGKTTLLTTIINELTQLGEHKPVTAFIVDKRLQLSQLEFPAMTEYIAHIDQIIPKNHALAGYLSERRPPADLTPKDLANWAFDHSPQYVIIDDVDFIPDSPSMIGSYAGERPWESLLEFLSQAHDLGLRVIATTKASNINQIVMTNQLLRTMVDMNCSLLLLNSKNPKEQIRTVKLMSGLVPGRGIYLPDVGGEPEYIQLFNPQL